MNHGALGTDRQTRADCRGTRDEFHQQRLNVKDLRQTVEALSMT